MRFIVVDGLDAAGKDTHARLIKQKYESKGENVIIRSHPSIDNVYGKNAKRALFKRGKKQRIKATIFYALDVLHSINRYYNNVDTLIFVRYLGGVAYLPYSMAKPLYHVFYNVLPTTDYMFFLDVDPEESYRRINGRNKKEMFENLDSLYEVREKALDLVEDWHIIDTNRPINEAQQDINKKLDYLDNNGHVLKQ